MLTFEDLTVANNNFYAARDGWTIDTIVIHSMAGTWQSANSRFNNPAAQVSAHRGICYDGIMRRWVEDEFTSYCNGVWTVNLRSLTIECEDMGDSWGERPDIVYSMCGALVAEWASMYPAIKLDRFHIVPGVAVHRDVYATACPAALDVDRIIAIARNIAEGGSTVAFDPINNPAHRQWLDDRYANKDDVRTTVDSMKARYDPVAAWAGQAPKPPVSMAEEQTTGPKPNLEPHTNMKGTPPADHPARQMKAGTHTPGNKAGKEES